MMGRRSVMSNVSPVILAIVLLCAVAAQDDPLKTNRVEFKTQAPPEPFPEAPKDCYEYLYGKLSAIRKHGTTWQNGVADCSNCTCDNGDIRCFFHFCNGPSTGYMTPPSVDNDLSLSVPAIERGVYPEKAEDVTEEESSGFPPDDLAYEDGEGETRAEWPPKILPEKWHKELSTFETSSAPSDASLPQADDDGEFSLAGEEERQDRSENETHDILKSFFCGKTCKKICPKGFKIDPVTGCWKCKCDTCPHHVTCETKCPSGYAVDARGCGTCDCVTPTASESKDGDIVFTDEAEEEGLALGADDDADADGGNNKNNNNEDDEESDEGGKGEEIKKGDERAEENEEGRKDSESGSSSSSSEEMEEEIGQLASPHTQSSSEARTVAPPEGRVTPKKEAEVTSFPGIKEGIFGLHGNDEEPCDTATSQLRGCLDGTQKFSVGETWSRGPCVACKCVAPGYSECNITQCHALTNCPQFRRFTPSGACCAICKDAAPSPPGLLEVLHDSHHASKTPAVDVSLQRDGASRLLKEPHHKTEDEEATIRSIPKGGDSHLLLILIPMGVLFLVGALLAHLWRRYHRDKYDINAYRPEEKQKLRPVKTLSDDSSSLGQIC